MDIRIDGRFRAYTEVGSITVRALSDLDTRERDRVALQASQEYADILANEASAAHLEFVAPLLELSEEDMRDALVPLRADEMVRVVEEELPYEYVPFPDNATLVERQEVLRNREAHEESVRRQRETVVAARLSKLTEKIEGWDAETLCAGVRAEAIATHSAAKYADVFSYMTLALACYHENGKPLFDSWEDVPKMSTRALQSLYAAYREVDEIDPWTLEKNVLTGPIPAGCEPENSPGS